MPFAERELNLKKKDGTLHPVRVRVLSPEDRGERGWEADIEILGPGDEVSLSRGSGIDGFQALESALFILPVLMGKFLVDGELCLGDEPGAHFPSIRLLPDELDVVAQRTLAFRPHQGHIRRVQIYLGQPYQRGMRDVWFVRANVIDGDRTLEPIQAEGADPIAALIEAIRRISARLWWYRERGRLSGADDLQKIAMALAEDAPGASTSKPDLRKVAITEVAESGRRLGAAVANAVRVLVGR